eukprot:2642139-Amphidinium_carterae.1
MARMEVAASQPCESREKCWRGSPVLARARSNILQEFELRSSFSFVFFGQGATQAGVTQGEGWLFKKFSLFGVKFLGFYPMCKAGTDRAF